ncbi:MAG TPA: EVE domain-containing protein, partial [Gemmatimonadaceae bacterium]|nr:EVE domain-containing protein [Gemmatimonadaceae bacterium]
MPRHWILKTEPSTYSYSDLERDGKAVWDGVHNPVAIRNLSEMKPGDDVLIYHTGAEKAVVGLARVTKAAYPDPKEKDPKLLVVDLAPVQRLSTAVTLAEIKSDPLFKDSPLVRQGRLSVVPLTEEQFRR